MHHMIRAGFAAALAIGVCSAAEAANLPVKKKAAVKGQPIVKAQPLTPPAPLVLVNSWAGMYVGIHAGAACPLVTTSNLTPFGGFDDGVARSYSFDKCRPLAGGTIRLQYGCRRLPAGL